MKLLILILITFSFATTIFGQQPDLSKLTEMEGGRRVLEYFKAFNSGDEQKLKDFFANNLTAESLARRGVEPRLEFHKQVRADFQTLEIKDVMSVEIRDVIEIKLLVQGKIGGWINYGFMFELATPQKLLGWQIEPTEAPNGDKSPTYQSPKTKAEFLSTVEKYLNDLVAEDKFSGVVMVAKDDKPIFSKAYGLADKEKKTPNSLETKFNLGSINKIFTRVAIGQLVQQGKVSFDDKLGKFLPDYPNKDAKEKVSIRHLVTMKSGVGDFFGEQFMNMPKDKFRKIADFIPLFADKPLAFEPGTKDQYSNGGYILLGAIIEKVTGKSYYDYVRENIFKVAGMSNTDSFETDKTPANTANGYFKEKNIWSNNINTRPYRGSSAGGGYSNAGDLLKFSVALKSGKISVPDDDGKPRQDKSLGIAGGSVGINAVFLVNAQNGYTIIVLSNYDPPSAEKIGAQIRDWSKQIKD